jgi:hypothetical protein
MSGSAEEVAQALSAFFAPPNRLRLETILDAHPDKGVGRFQRWVKPLLNSPAQATLLPCQRSPDRVDWYAVAFDDRQFRTLREELIAFVGPSYSRFRGEAAGLSPSDPVEIAIRRLAGNRVSLVAAPKGEAAQGAVWRALERMRELRNRKQHRNPEVADPLDLVLRQFYLSLRTGSRTKAEERLRLLRDRYAFGTWNLLFLRVQMLYDLGRWGELLDLPQLPDLLRIRRPLAVTEALITAVYHRHLEHFEQRDDPRGAAAFFADEVYPRYPGLYSFRTGLQSPEASKSFMLLAVAQEEPDLDLRDRILSESRLPPSEQRYLDHLGRLAPASQVQKSSLDPISFAAQAWRAGRYDEAYQAAIAAPVSVERAQVLLQCAYELPALEVRRAAIGAVGDLEESERASLLDRRWAYEIWLDVSSAGEETSLPAGWVEWLERVDEGWQSSEAVSTAREGAAQWDPRELLARDEVALLADSLIEARDAGAENTLQHALPHLLSFFQDDPDWPRRDFLPVYDSLTFLLAATDTGGQDELSLFNDLMEATLRLGATESRYAELTGWAMELWQRFEAMRNFDWALDLLDILAGYPAPAKEMRDRILNSVAGSIHQFLAQGRRLQPQQRMLFERYCRAFGQQELCEFVEDEESRSGADDGETDDPLRLLAGQNVSIYTLTERAGERVSAILLDECPEVTVQVLSDKVCTDRLKAAAQSSDIFVLAIASAKHAASDCVHDNRSDVSSILYPTGKGSSSMLTAIVSYLTDRS